MAPPETHLRASSSRDSEYPDRPPNIVFQQRYDRLGKRATAFRPQNEFAALLKNVCLSILETFPPCQEEWFDRTDITDTILSLLPP